MTLHPAVVVHGSEDARAALAVGLPVTLLSAPGAALFAGCLWWRAMIDQARAAHPAVPMRDILDCADAPGRALAAIRAGQQILTLSPTVPAFPAVAAIAAARGAVLLAQRPPALDLGERNTLRRLPAWLASA